MKVESLENGVKLIPETPYEQEQLTRLRIKGVAKSYFQDDWNGTGYLTIDLNRPYWDKNE